MCIMDKAFSGFLEFDEPPFKVTAPNITQDKESGIGTWSAADIRKLLRTGVRPNGVTIATIMPTGFYDIITKKDMDAIVAYVQTLKPIKNKVPDPIYKMPQVRQIFPGAEKPYTEAMFSDRLKHGFYLATIAHCMKCHTPMEKGVRQFKLIFNSCGVATWVKCLIFQESRAGFREYVVPRSNALCLISMVYDLSLIHISEPTRPY